MIAAKTPKTKKAVHEYRGAQIIEWENARKGQQFQIIDPNGYHYRYSYDMGGAEAIVDGALQWGW